MTRTLRPRSGWSAGGPGGAVALVLAPILLHLLLACHIVLPAQSIFNCLPQHMFKMGKGGYQGGYQQPVSGYGGGPERANWYPQPRYPQQQQPAYPALNPYAGYGGYSPMKSLFQPKWMRGGGSLFGAKRWNNWRAQMNNYYRPGYGYGGYGLGIPTGSPLGGIGQSYSEQLNVDPTYTSLNDGWSVSSVPGYNSVQTKLTGYDSHIVQPPLRQPLGTSLNPYSTKSGTYSNKIGTKNILLADGGYDAFDAHQLGNLIGNSSYGYSYPEWYSGVVESPAKIAQQLLKYGFRARQSQNRSAPLVASSGGSAQFTILDEPRFVGYGTVDVLNNKEARLSCSFGEAIDQTNRPLWVKFSGPYNSSQVVNGKIVPPFNCANSLCRTQEVETTKDYRYRFDNGPATSTLIISEPRLSDYAIYRCSALTKTISNSPIETIYQIVRFGNL